MIPSQLTLSAIQESFRDLYDKVGPWIGNGNVDFNGRRIINAGASVGAFDYVTRLEMDRSIADTSSGLAVEIQRGPLSNVGPVRVGTFALRGTPVAHAQEIFMASDLDYMAWVSTGTAWVYAYGMRSIAQSAIAAFTALLTANDVGALINVTDYTHMLRWTGSALGFAPGDNGSFFFQDFPGTPTGGTWGLCDGTTYNYLKADGTTGSYATKNLSGHYRKSVTSGADATAAAIAPTFTGTPAVLTGSVSAPNFTGTPGTTGNDSGSGTIVMAGVGTTVATHTHTHGFTPAGTNDAPALTMDSYTPAGTNGTDGEPAAFKTLTFFRR